MCIRDRFYVYHQLYDEKTGKPVEGAYVDLNGDGEINTEDLYRYHSPAPVSYTHLDVYKRQYVFFPHHRSLFFLFISYPVSWIVTILMQVVCYYFVRKSCIRHLQGIRPLLHKS